MAIKYMLQSFQSLRFYAQVKTSGIQSGTTASIYVEQHTSSGTLISGTVSPVITSNTDWTPITIDVTTVSNCVKVRVFNILNGQGTCWFDNAVMLRL